MRVFLGGLACCFIIGVLSGCQQQIENPPEPPVVKDPFTKEEAIRWIDSKNQAIEKIDCADALFADECAEAPLKFSDGQHAPWNVDNNQTILVLDTHLTFSAVSRYRSRILAILEQVDGVYREADPSVSLPNYVRDLFQEINFYQDTEQRRQFLPTAWLDPLYETVADRYPGNTYLDYIGHGVTPFLYLLEHNPQAEFIAAPAPDFFTQFSDDFCTQNVVSLTQRIEAASNDFKVQVFDHFGVDYVNYSGGVTLATVKDRWNSHCTLPLPSDDELRELLGTFHAFFNVLFNSEGVFGFQATDVDMTVATHPLDTDEENRYKNRMLVGDFTTETEASKLPENGLVKPEDAPELRENRNNSKQWIDYFLNFGVELKRPFDTNETPLLEVSSLGLGWFPTTSMQPSWAAPAALSRAIHVKNRVLNVPDAELTDELIIEIWDVMAPKVDMSHGDVISCRYDGDTAQVVRCKRQDPLKFRQHEIYYLFSDL